ncbi:glycosyl hydrolase 108 family protein [Neokomagataea anthophila]|uniref:TtsA-like Glycoside hydrolase family 108 domain-containing protein n=1 Tax=Neokomagataea anthophila TaxID=2826925 RepID=A0ABS5E6T0_9PROT|nr:glycosyl hydrolase 108 family protein [Neokomagataea anthophila]MBR0559516.1 hypothetical protein [Neokomagataea anthophila]
MQSNFSTITQFTASREGLYQCLRDDPGNWTLGAVGCGRLVGTMRGISAPVMGRWVGDPHLITPKIMQAISAETFSAIYAALYWRAINGAHLPSGIDVMLCDFAFNAGIARSAKQLQQIIGFVPSDIDGDIGPQTLHALETAPLSVIAGAVTGSYRTALQRDVGVTPDGVLGIETLQTVEQMGQRHRLIVYALASRQEAAYRSFQKFTYFGRGWLERLAERLALALRVVAAPEM